MEAILESCDENAFSSRPIIIIGDYNGRGYRSSIIRLNHSFEIVKYSERDEFKQFQASKIIISGGSPEQIHKSIEKLRKSLWRMDTIHFFFIGSCRNAARVLIIALRNGLLNSIYICTRLDNISVLLTTNGIGNHAPHPWQKFRTGIGQYHIFLQVFKPHVSCTNLYYDRTTKLNGFRIRIVKQGDPKELGLGPGSVFRLGLLPSSSERPVNEQIMQTIIMKLNATTTVEFERDITSVIDRCATRTADFALELVNLRDHPGISCLFPFRSGEIIAVVKLNQEVSTLSKIRHLWSTAVLILAAIALAILYLVLTIMNHDFSVAILNLTRLLIYSHILRISKRHSFRIYFTTMLIFMVISNGVFQSKIAAFLTTRERKHSIKTINELVKLDYKMYTFSSMADGLNLYCPKCHIKEVRQDVCINRVLNFDRHACAMPKTIYERDYSHLSLDQVKEPLMSSSRWTFCHHMHWHLADSANRIVRRLVESGLINFWNERLTHKARRERQEREAEWLSPEYRPVKLYKLAFAFYGLALGLLISTIVFLMKLWVANYKIFEKKFNTSKCLTKFRKRKVAV